MRKRAAKAASRSIRDPLERFTIFCEKAKELRESDWARGGLGVKASESWNAAEGEIKIIIKEPQETPLKAFLLTFRHFILRDGPIHIDSIYNLCAVHITDEKYREYLIKSRDFYRNALHSSAIDLIQNGENISTEYIVDLLINGQYFHSDNDKRKALRELSPAKFAYMSNFLNFVHRATTQIFYVDDVIRAALKEGKIQTDPNKLGRPE